MFPFGVALREIEDLKRQGLVTDYAVAGAMAMVFWTEPLPTYDLDVLVVLPATTGVLISLAPIYRWAEARGFVVTHEHVIIGGVPTQFLPSPHALADEAIGTAATLDYEGVPVRVVRPEYLIALYLMPDARSARRRERAALLLELPNLDHDRVRELLERYGLRF